jgi:UDP-2,3-diacylglucosamine pyrophosphatase LpxH
MIPLSFHTIIISDIHLGSPMCQAKTLLKFLKNIRVKNLILNGDVFEDLNFNRLQKWHWKCFGQIRKISDHCKVIWNRGNHDEIDSKFLSHLLGVTITDQYKFKAFGKKMFAAHGDQWDRYIYRHPIATKILTEIYRFLQKIMATHMTKATRYLKKKSKLLLKNHQTLLDNAFDFALNNDFEAVFYGHTHKACLDYREGKIYGNSGTWESDDPHFIGISRTGIHLCRYEKTGRVTIIQKFSFSLTLKTLTDKIQLQPEPVLALQ